MSRNLRTASVLSGFALAAGLSMPTVATAQDSSAVVHMKAGAGKAPVTGPTGKEGQSHDCRVRGSDEPPYR